jgi:hypothetical protein
VTRSRRSTGLIESEKPLVQPSRRRKKTLFKKPSFQESGADFIAGSFQAPASLFALARTFRRAGRVAASATSIMWLAIATGCV